LLSPETLSRLGDYWARELGCVADALNREQNLVIALAAKDGSDYARVFRRGSCRVLTCSPSLLPLLAREDRRRPSDLDDTTFLKSALDGRVTEVFSRVYLGYADTMFPDHVEARARLLCADDASALEALRAGVSPREWEHSGIDSSQAVAGCFVASELVAAAGYEVWGGSIAHIGVVTAPAHRSQGHGRTAVAQIANQAIGTGLVAQYRALGSNAASIAVAHALGFCAYAEYTYALVGQPN
jgi:GNAT superfamily N-acetyltransferase